MPDVEVFRRFTENTRIPVLISRRDLRIRGNFFAYRDDAGDFAADRLGVFDFQSAGAPEPGANAARGDAAGKNLENVLTEARDLRLDLRFRSVADADHRDDGADADDDAKRGENGAEFILAQCASGNLETGTESHG